jgi:hypothetical protein
MAGFACASLAAWLVSEAPTAALAVASMIAKAAISTRSDRDSASLVLLVIGEFDSFGFWFRFVYLACSISRSARFAPSPASLRVCYFD